MSYFPSSSSLCCGIQLVTPYNLILRSGILVCFSKRSLLKGAGWRVRKRTEEVERLGIWIRYDQQSCKAGDVDADPESKQ